MYEGHSLIYGSFFLGGGGAVGQTVTAWEMVYTCFKVHDMYLQMLPLSGGIMSRSHW